MWRNLVNKKSKNVITIDNKEYELDKLNDAAKTQLDNLKFVEERITQLQNEWAVSDTARIGYSKALEKELKVV